jgi:serine/threonine protein phosphatase PrpC
MIQFAANSHPGMKRDQNEDSYVADPQLKLWLVADGVGGHSFGEVASLIVAETVRQEYSGSSDLYEGVCRAHSAILREMAQREETRGMGSTVVAMGMQASNYDIVWVGDSRAYLWDGNALVQITQDHSHVAALVARGVISSEDAFTHPERNVLTQSMGISADMQLSPDRVSGVLAPDQQIILCSDGLNDEISDSEIAAQMSQNDSAQGQVDGLINAALEAGGKDNITVVVVGLPARPAAISSAAAPDLETTQSVGQAVRSSSGERESHSVKIWIICFVLAVLVGLVAWL